MSNAKRFGGAHSPGNGRPAAPEMTPPRSPRRSRLAGRAAKRFSWRVLGLYLAPSPLIVSGLWQVITIDLPEVLWTFGPWGILMLAAWLTGEGLRAEAAYDARPIARPPAIPRKLFGAAFIGLGVFAAAALGGGQGLIMGIIFGALAAGAHVMAFGLDPMRSKGGAGVSSEELDRVAAKLDEAEAVVAETVAAADTLRDRALQRRIDALAYAARDILKEIQGDPRDLRRARRFLSVYLVGLRDATVKFAAARAKGGAERLRGEYENLLVDLEASFAKQRETLLIEDHTALEVEIDVLRDRLRQEGAL